MTRRQTARPLTKRQLTELEKDLTLQKTIILNKSLDTKNELRTSEDDRADEADQATSDNNKSMFTRQHNREQLYLKKVEQALQRIEDNVYGICVDCDAPIGYPRMKARPTAELCILCKEEEERRESNSVLKKIHKSQGQRVVLQPGR